MGETQVQKDEAKKKEKKKIVAKKLPPCTTAASAEHSRAQDDGEPCDDGREGDIE